MKYLTIVEAAAFLPGRPHKNTVSRWMLKGVNGIRLRSGKVGGKRYTTPTWCDEFVAATMAAESGQADHLAASAELENMGS